MKMSKKLKKQMELFDIIMESEVPVENAWELFSMGLKELQDEGLISVNLENLAFVFLKYQSGEHAEYGKRRIGKFTEVLGEVDWSADLNARRYSTTLVSIKE